MLCGQGSVGKSTYIKKYYPNAQHISIDKIVGKEVYDPLQHFNIYIQNIQNAINSGSQQITLDFSHDTIDSRASVLDKLILDKKIDFKVIALHPELNFIYSNMEKRLKKKLTYEEQMRIKHCYNCFQFPTKKEFEKYEFNSVKVVKLYKY